MSTLTVKNTLESVDAIANATVQCKRAFMDTTNMVCKGENLN